MEYPKEYLKEYERKITLKDGTRVLFRPELSTDTEMLWEMFSTLSKESLRFLVLPFTRERVERWTCNISYDRALPILAVVREGRKKRVVADASLSFFDAEAFKHKAEFGITVHDDFQNRGIGTLLTQQMLQIARNKKLRKVFLKVLTENKRAIYMYQKCGFKIEAKLKKENFVYGRYYDDYIMSIFL
jgi:RimJ/RimL family protein N-acetyltransferase